MRYFRQNLARKEREIFREDKRFPVEQIVGILKQAEVGVPLRELLILRNADGVCIDAVTRFSPRPHGENLALPTARTRRPKFRIQGWRRPTPKAQSRPQRCPHL